MIGRICKILSDFYYVETEIGLVEAKLKNVLKKRKEKVYTGDYAELEEFDPELKQAFIKCVVNRRNFISRPKAANISQIIIVSALKSPDLDFEQLNRYIASCEYHNIRAVLCFNKEDINESETLKQKIIDTYEPLKYKIVFASALQNTGIDGLRPLLLNNTSVLCGSSGTGKSSLINTLLQSSRLKISPVSGKTGKGTHTTRHCELISLDKNTFVADTPGFSHLKFDFLLPSEIAGLFAEFKNKKFACKYKNCLHTGEAGCGAEEIILNMKKERYESYKKFVDEAKSYEEMISKKSIKKEAAKKFNKNRIMTKISNKKRNLSRKTLNQNISKEEI